MRRVALVAEPETTAETTAETTLGRAGEPVAFAGCAGFFHAAAGDVGIVLLSPWGFEAFCVHAAWRALAERLARAHYPVLRFDWPGCGDSLGSCAQEGSLAQWRAAALAGVKLLRSVSGCRRVVLAGQGLGALIGADLAGEVDGLIALAPQVAGRAGWRELDLWGRAVASALRIPFELGPDQALNVGGFRMARALHDEFRAFQPRTTPLTGKAALVLARPERDSDRDFAEALAARGANVEVLPFVDYAASVAHLETPSVPQQDHQRIVDWLGRTFAAQDMREQAGQAAVGQAAGAEAFAAQLEGPDFVEQGLTFGPGRRLFGVLTSPKGAVRASVVIANSGYNPHAGWGRGHVTLARLLAARGVAVLRMDCAGLGDSVADPAQQGDVLYSDGQFADMGAALDALAQRGLGRFVLAGRCSGAYIAQHVAERDERVCGLVSVNALRLIWDPRETLEQAMAGGSGSLRSYGARALSRETLMRILRGEVALLPLAGRVVRKLGSKMFGGLLQRSGRLSVAGRLTAQVRARFAGFGRRRLPVVMVYADGDGGLDELARYCGTGGNWLRRFANVQVINVPEADHTMSADHAQKAIFDAVESVIQQIETLNQTPPASV